MHSELSDLIALLPDQKRKEFAAAWSGAAAPTLSAQGYDSYGPECVSRGTGTETGVHLTATLANTLDDGSYTDLNVSTLPVDTDKVEFGFTVVTPFMALSSDPVLTAQSSGYITSAYWYYSLDLPAGATINKAVLRGTSASSFVGTARVAAALGTVTGPPASRAQAEAYAYTGGVEWVSDWAAADISVESPDIACAVQAVVDQADWTRGEPALLIAFGSATSSDIASLQDGSTTLHVWYDPSVTQADGSGGAVAGGSTSAAVTYSVSAAGGIVGGGEAWAQHGLPLESAGLTAGGIGVSGMEITQSIASAGVVVGGAALVPTYHDITMAGGAVVSDYLRLWFREIEVPASRVSESLDKYLLSVACVIPASKLGDPAAIFFTTLAGARLPHELRSYDPATGALIAVVKTVLLSDADNFVKLFYGATEAA